MTKKIKSGALIGGPVLAAVGGLSLAAAGHNSAICWTAGITILVATWWIFEPIPIPVTSMIPFGLFPLVGLRDYKQVAQAYGGEIGKKLKT